MQRKRVAVIPARGGSKRIPKKNIVDFCGKPMIAWTILAAIESGQFDQVLVSTDDNEIADIAQQWGAEVPFLRDNHSDDTAKAVDATLDTLNKYEKLSGASYSTIAQLMANCPLRSSTSIRDAVEFFDEHKGDFQISAFKYGWMNPWWAIKLNADGSGDALHKNAIQNKSQHLESLYCPTGAIWIASTDALRQEGTFYGPNYRLYIMNWKQSVDIDTMDDLEFGKLVKNIGVLEDKA